MGASGCRIIVGARGCRIMVGARGCRMMVVGLVEVQVVG